MINRNGECSTSVSGLSRRQVTRARNLNYLNYGSYYLAGQIFISSSALAGVRPAR